MKKCFSFLLALTLMLAVCAAASAETITLKIAHNYDFVTIPNSVIAAADRLNERYAAEGKDIKIEFETDYQRIDWGEYGQNLIFAYKNGDCPDIFSVSDVPTMAAVGMLLDLSDLNQDAFVDGAFTSFTVDGVPYAMPFDLPVRVIYYNKQVLVNYGWTMEEAEALPAKVAAGEFTWEDFVQLCTDVKNAGACTWGLCHRPGSGNDFLDVMRTLGGRYYDENGTLNVVTTRQILHYSYRALEESSPTLIYGYTVEDVKQNGSVLYQLLVPAQEQNEGISIANVRLMYGSVDRVIHLPSACIAARLGTKSVYGFSQNAVYVCSFGETTFRAYALPINVTAVLGMMNDNRAVVASGSEIYVIELPT